MHDEREKAVLDAAENVFWKRGYQATSFQDLTAAGLSRRAVYSRYESKEGLFDAVLSRYRDEYTAFVVGALKDTDVDGVSGFLSQLREMVGTKFAGRGCLIANAGCELAPLQPSVGRHFDEHFSEMNQLLVAAFARSHKDGTFSGDIRGTAAAVTCAVLGSFVLARSGQTELAKAGLDGAIGCINVATP